MSSIVISSEMFEMFAPSFYISRFFCLQPMKWIKCGPNYTILKSKSYIVYSILVVFFCVAASIYGLTQLYKLHIVYAIRLGDQIKCFVTSVEVALVFIPSVLGVITASFNVDNYIKYLQHLRKFDFLVQKQPVRSKKYLFVNITTMCYMTVVLIFDLIMWINMCYGEEQMFLLLIQFCPYYYCYCFTVVIELVYWQCVHSIKVRIILLNEKFRRYVRDTTKINNIVNVVTICDLKKQFQNKETLRMDQILNLIKAYEKLLQATDLVNGCYGFLIMVVILGCLIFLLVTPYALYSIINNGGNGASITILSMWMMGHIMRLCLIIEPCHGCLVENGYTSAILCELLSQDLRDKERQFLQFFLTYLAQCPTVFTAFGMTKICRRLLVAITGAVTTYLVILFQFNKK